MGNPKQRIQKEQEFGARRAILEDLFYDFNSSRARVYRLSFFRGIFLGVGTVIGGTIVIAILVWVLDFFTGIPGGIGEFVQHLVDIVNQSTAQ